MPDRATPLISKIVAGEALEGSDEIFRALREAMPAAEQWAGRDIVLECNERGWSVLFTHGNNCRDRLTDRCGYRFICAEDAIEALVTLIAKNKAAAGRGEAINA